MEQSSAKTNQPRTEEPSAMRVNTSSISHKSTKYDLFLVGYISHPVDCIEVLERLEEVGPGDTLNIHINSTGGSVATATTLINRIKNLDAKVNIYVNGECMSAATIILLGLYDKASNVDIDPYTTFLFHTFRTNGGGKISDGKAAFEFLDKKREMIYEDLFSEILTDREMDEVSDGQEVYFLGTEISERLKVRDKKRSKK